MKAYRHLVILNKILNKNMQNCDKIVWNTLLLTVHIQSPPSIATFHQRLKTFLVQQSFPDIIIWYY